MYPLYAKKNSMEMLKLFCRCVVFSDIEDDVLSDIEDE
jgi:hypothetical protein